MTTTPGSILLYGLVLGTTFRCLKNRQALQQRKTQSLALFVLLGSSLIAILQVLYVQSTSLYHSFDSVGTGTEVPPFFQSDFSRLGIILGTSVILGVLNYIITDVLKKASLSCWPYSEWLSHKNSGRIFTEAFSPHIFLQKMVTNIHKNISCTQCGIYSIIPGNIANHCWSGHPTHKIHSFSDNREFIRWLSAEIYLTKHVRNIRDISDENFPWAPLVSKAGIRSLLLVPIIRNGKCIAHLSLSSTKSGSFSINDENTLTFLSKSLGAAIQHVAIRELAIERLGLIEILDRIGATLNSPDLERQIAKSAIACTGADFVQVFIRNKRTSNFKLHATETKESPSPIFHTPFNEGDEIPKELFINDEPIVVSNIQTDPRWTAGSLFPSRDEFQAFLAQPLKMGDEIIGVLVCFSALRDFFRKKDVDFMADFASKASIVIHNAGLCKVEDTSEGRFNQLIRNFQTPEPKADIIQPLRSLCETVSVFTSFEMSLYILDENDLLLVNSSSGASEIMKKERIALQEFPALQTAFAGEPVVNTKLETQSFRLMINNNLEREVPSLYFLILPLVFQTQVIGVLIFCKEKGKKFTKDQVNIAEGLAEQAIGVIESVRSRERKWHTKKLLLDIFENNPRAIYVTDKEQRIILWNRAAEHQFGYSEDEAFGKDLKSLIGSKSLPGKQVSPKEYRPTEKTGTSDSAATEGCQGNRYRTFIPPKFSHLPIFNKMGYVVANCGISENTS